MTDIEAVKARLREDAKYNEQQTRKYGSSADVMEFETDDVTALLDAHDAAEARIAKLEEAVDYADRAHSRLLYYASLAHNGKAELNGREMARQVSGAFSEFNECGLPFLADLRRAAAALEEK